MMDTILLSTMKNRASFHSIRTTGAFIRTLFVTLIVMSVATEITSAVCPLGDYDGNCRVNIDDLAFMMDYWLEPLADNPAELSNDDDVNLRDFSLLAKNYGTSGIPIMINEILASNPYTLEKDTDPNHASWKDPQGEFEDWIELYNYGPDPVDVGGMYLTDDMGNKIKWQIPNDQPTETTIAAGGYLIIWADEDEDDTGLHASFALSSSGEKIAMHDIDGQTLVDKMEYYNQQADISYGYYPDAQGDLRFMSLPSPGVANNQAYLGVIEDVSFSVKRGFYDQPFTVTLSTESAAADIYYTTDGSEPYKDANPAAGTVYSSPISVTGTTCLRAKAVRTGYKPSRDETHTYIYLDQVIQQDATPAGWPSAWDVGSVEQARYPNDPISRVSDYEMDPNITSDPQYSSLMRDSLLAHKTISLTMDIDDFIGVENGIYNNPRMQGVEWERFTSVEVIDPNGGEEIQLNAGLRIQGGVSRNLNRPKHNLRLLFKAIYGYSKLEYPLFDDWPVERFDTIVLRGANGDSWFHTGSGVRDRAQYSRDEFMRQTQQEMGHTTSGQGNVHLYVNGLYWGFYHTIERPNASFWAEHLGGDKEDYDAIRHKNQTVDGTRDAWDAMMAIARGGLTDHSDYEAVLQYVDVENLIDYMMMNIYAENWDWDRNNWYGGRKRSPEGRFRFCSWDAEKTWERDALTYDITDVFRDNQPSELHQALSENAEYKLRFADRIQQHMFNDGLLTPAVVQARWQSRVDEIRTSLIAESARWGDSKRADQPYTVNNEFDAETARLYADQFPQRTAAVIEQFKAKGLYPNIEAVAFNQYGGYVASGFDLTMTAPVGAIWYTTDGTDPRLPGGSSIPETETTLVAENAPKKALIPTGAISDNWKGAAAFDDSGWLSTSASPGGVGYDTGSTYVPYISLDVIAMRNTNATCYIRIPFTITTLPAVGDALKLNIRYDDGFVAYINGVEVQQANAPATLAWNSSATTNHVDSAAVVLQEFDISSHLSDLKLGENILAIHGLNSSTGSTDLLFSAELKSITPASSGAPEISPNAIEYTSPVELTQTTQVKARALNGNEWSALTDEIFATGLIADNLRITEIMYNPDSTTPPSDPNEEFIELKNIGTEPININLVQFYNGVDFTFPNMTLAPGEYTVVVEDTAVFNAKYPSFSGTIAGQFDGRFNNGGERTGLKDAAGTIIHNFRFRDGWYNLTDGQGFSLTVRDPNTANPSDYDTKDNWRSSALAGGSPGWDDSGFVPEPGSVVINEVLAHSHDAAPDWIELHNTTSAAINIGGWYLSDKDTNDPNRMKYRIPDVTSIPAGGYVVFYEDDHFGNASNPDALIPFALSENGEKVVLHSGQGGVITGYRDAEDFGASPTGIAFGRYYKASTDEYNFVLMDSNTPGTANALPKVGPIVINEIMYKPASGIEDAEYIELLNISESPVTLYDSMTAEPWKFTDGIEYTFDSVTPLTIPSGGFVLIVKDEAAFTAEYGSAPAGVPVLEYETGNLSNGGEKLELSMPGDVDDLYIRQYIRVDRVNYSDGSHPVGEDPWPAAADGTGMSLSRITAGSYGNDVANWKAAAHSPGIANP